jgi:hypothetical protein
MPVCQHPAAPASSPDAVNSHRHRRLPSSLGAAIDNAPDANRIANVWVTETGIDTVENLMHLQTNQLNWNNKL